MKKQYMSTLFKSPKRSTMFYFKIKRSFTNYTDAKFIDFCNGLIQGLTDNSYFPNIADALAVFKTSFDKFVASIPPRNTRNMVNTAIKNENRLEANRQAIILSFLVEYEAKLNEAALRSSNFKITNRPQSKGLVGTVKGLSLSSNGIANMMIVQCDADANASLYNVRASTDEENWKWFGAKTSRKVHITDLPNGEKLFVQMRLENAHGHSPWSTSVVGMIGVPEMVPSIHD